MNLEGYGVGSNTNPIRSRSLYTMQSVYQGENYDIQESSQASEQGFGDNLFNSLNEADKYFVNSSYFRSEDGPKWQRKQSKWQERVITDAPELTRGTAIATPSGLMSLLLKDDVRVDMTIDRAVRIVSAKHNIVMALDAPGAVAAVMHANGRIYQYGSRVEIVAHDLNHGNHKYAKMCYKGVSFTSEECALVYIVDDTGTKTTTDKFTDMKHDFSLPVFYNYSNCGPQYVQDAISLLEAGQYWETDNGVFTWIINNVKISQSTDGLVRIARDTSKYLIRTCPNVGTASLTTPFVHCTASLGQTSHLFVRRGERRMHYDGSSFIVRNGCHSAGFDDKNQLKVY